MTDNKTEEETGILCYFDDEIKEYKRKDALLIMSFGSTYSEARKLSIDAVMKEIRTEFPDLRVELAFSSGAVRHRIEQESGEKFLSVEEAADKLYNEGCTRLLMQPLSVLPDTEYEEERDTYYLIRHKFFRAVLGVPLLYWTGAGGTHDDLREMYLNLKQVLPALGEDEAVVIAGHGSYHWTNDYFYILEDKIAILGFENYYVAALKGTPTIDDVIVKLWRKKVKKVLVLPLMITGGYHVTCDMNGDKPESVRKKLEAAGFEVRVKLQGIAEYPEIRRLFIKRIEQALSKLNK